MCEVTFQPRQRKPTSKSGRSVTGTRRGSPSVFLTLPAFSSQVPIQSVTNHEGEGWLKAANLCAELVKDDELVINHQTSARDIVSQALSVWASRLCVDINLLDSFTIIASCWRLYRTAQMRRSSIKLTPQTDMQHKGHFRALCFVS